MYFLSGILDTNGRFSSVDMYNKSGPNFFALIKNRFDSSKYIL